MATIHDVAALAGVSASTVSRALSGNVIVSANTKAKVLEAVKALNYQPNPLAKGLKEGSTRTIAVIVPNLKNLLFPAAISGITEVASAHGYTIVLCSTDEDLEKEKADVANLVRRKIDGFVFFTATRKSQHILDLVALGHPTVLLVRHLPEAPVNSVSVDNELGAYKGTKFLVERGYRRIALICGDRDLVLYQERFRGYEKALAEAGLPVEFALVRWNVRGWRQGHAAMKELLQSDRSAWPDAVFASSDPKALGIMKAIKEAGLRIPEDMAVMGYDNMELGELTEPALTTVAQPFYKTGVVGTERLMRLMQSKGDAEPEQVKLEPTVLIRQSVGYV